MKRHVPLILLLFLVAPGSFIQASPTKKKITVTVIDSRTEKPVHNAQVTIVAIKDARDISTDIRNSDAKGKCSFMLEFNSSMQYNMYVRKEKFYPFYSIDPGSKRSSFRNGISDSEKEIQLYISSDSSELISYYSQITPHIPVDTLIVMLKADRYNAENLSCLPALEWNDIPKLITIGNDRARVTRFPRSPLSSYDQPACYAGILALWMIESIRISEGRSLISPQERMPSLFPRFRSRSTDKEQPIYGKVDSPETLQKAYLSYALWWKKIRNMDRKEAAKIDPLANTDISW